MVMKTQEVTNDNDHDTMFDLLIVCFERQQLYLIRKRRKRDYTTKSSVTERQPQLCIPD